MPTYEYACPDCGNKFELKQKFTDDAVKLCPRCGKLKVYRVVGQVAITFKGSGWYITDSKSSGDKHTLDHHKEHTPASADAGKTETKTEGASDTKAKSETKTETKTESKPVTEKSKSA